MSNPLIGKPAPTFSLPNYTGDTYDFNPAEIGIPTALFFYPSSGTYGCTKEACAFRDAVAEKGVFKTQVNVIGVSSNPVAKQKEFVKKNNLTYPVLSDAKGEARKAYHTSKGLLGLSDSRATFIIDSKGVVRDVFDSVLNYGGHTKFIEKWLTKLQSEEKPAQTATSTSAAEPAPQSPPVPEASTEQTEEVSKAAAAVQA
ncbi:hypothetical protein EUX98_g3020 [Antrodiella citrinella]|uniref:thioredoxin-dependent peroxiredoxin n=1 Tax=Antrodiella citrinella TaxID=2447956 RepID=A0A4V3XJ01_9APHY|nr:hypothetical protein EUX98_g3020 [Antrodiella citrinella]